MTQLKVEVDPAEVGFDAGRLARIDRHFARYVDDGRLPGWLILVARDGRIAHLSTYGQRDLEAGLPVETDTLFRIYSMTKPITSVAAMSLYEEGAFELTDPLSRYLPAFSDARIYVGGPPAAPATVPATEPIRIWHLLTHTAGFTYGFNYLEPVDAMYRAAGVEWTAPRGVDLATVCDRLAGLPLLFEPGARWNYSIATDVLGRLLEVLTGQSLDRVLADRVLNPLGMTDTRFVVREQDRDRLAALYTPAPTTQRAVRQDELGGVAFDDGRFLSGGGGLVSTAADYHRFATMLLNGGELAGVRILGPRTLRYMTRNHLPGNVDLQTYGRPIFAETRYDGVGFGLGFSVVVDPAAYRTIASRGEFAWGGAASTAFWVDPVERVTVLLLTQLLPSSTWPLRTQLKQLVHGALVD